MSEFDHSAHLCPSGWTRKPLVDLVNVDPESLKESFDPNSTFHYIDISAASEGRLVIPSTKITFRDAPSRARKVVERRDVLMSTVRPNLKAFAYFDHTDAFCVASTGFAILRAKDDTDARFILYTILSDDITSQIEEHVVGSNYPAITTGSVRRLSVLTPPSIEQRKIAKILSTVDNLIEKTQALIDKYQSIKQGMMYDLFTRGVDEKVSDLSRGNRFVAKLWPYDFMPQGWSYIPLSNLVSKVVGGAGIKPEEYAEYGVPVISKGDVTESSYIFTEYAKQYVSSEVALKYTRSMAKEDYVVVTLRDLVPSAPSVGMASVVSAKEDFLLAQGAYGLLLDENRILSRFFVEMTRTTWFRNYMRKSAVGSTQVHVRSSEYLDMLVPLPPIETQKKIINVMDCSDSLMKSELQRLNKLKNIKIGLMHDLLTGHVRVSP